MSQRTFCINLNAHYNDKFEQRRTDDYGSKALLLRLAVEANLIRMTPIGLALATSTIQGPYPYKHSFVIPTRERERKWFDVFNGKAKSLGVSVSHLGRVCLCLFLDELEAVEEEREHERTG